MKNSVDTIKALAYILFLIVVVVLANIPAHAYEIKGTWQLYDTETNSVIRNVTDGNRIDLHQVNRGNLALVASFTYKRSGDGLADHTAWVSWSLTHSARPNQHTQRTDQEDATGGWWPVCGATDGEVNRCEDLSTVGTFTIDAGAWFSDERTTGLLGSDSLVIRIVDTKPVKRPPSRPSGPVCHGDPEACKEIIANTPLWEALKRLCVNFPGGDLGIGNGATMRCPD